MFGIQLVDTNVRPATYMLLAMSICSATLTVPIIKRLRGYTVSQIQNISNAGLLCRTDIYRLGFTTSFHLLIAENVTVHHLQKGAFQQNNSARNVNSIVSQHYLTTTV